MAVELKRVALDDEKQREFQQNVADAVEELAQQKAPPVGVLRVSASRKLVGNEDYVLVDASAATGEISLVLPGVKILQRAMTVKVTRSNPSFGVTVKAADIPAPGTPTIDDVSTVSIAADTTGRLIIVSDGRNYVTVQ